VLVELGAENLALRAIAREMGMSAPALYRYYDSREALVEHVVADLYDELTAAIAAARDAAGPSTGARVLAASRAFRRWATGHPAEFGLLFGSPTDRAVTSDRTEFRPDQEHGPAQAAGERFGAVFGELVAAVYLERGFAIPADEDIDPALRPQLTEWCTVFPVALPLGVMQVFLSCWIRLYGMVCMEVFGHLQFALTDAEPMFEAELQRLGERLGIGDEYRRPRPAR
jgi:AcrR family transcriptional regulator